MSIDHAPKVDFKSLSISDQASYILKERTPKKEEVIYDPTIAFLDPNNVLTREEKGKVIAMGDRTATSYSQLAERVIKGRDDPEGTSKFLLAYALAAKSSNEISHTSILEQINPGISEMGGDSPIILEGVSVLAGLRDVCTLRHAGFEAFSSRGGVFPDGYWRVPEELKTTNIARDLESINREVYNVYLELTYHGLKHYLGTLKQKEGEENWQYRWRVLNSALDESRQGTNQSFLNHLSMHANSALALREGVVELGSCELPETREIADKLRELGGMGLPTLFRHTEASEYRKKLDQRRRMLGNYISDAVEPSEKLRDSEFLRADVSSDADRTFLAAFLATNNKSSFDENRSALKQLSQEKVEEMIQIIFSGFGIHDKPPKELEMVQITAESNMSIGGFYEAVRHRLATHVVGSFDSETYTTPQIYKELNLMEEYNYAINLNRKARKLIKTLGSAYEVFVPYFASRADIIPVTMRISAMDVFHFLKLRASESAHIDIRKPSGELEDFLRKSGSSIFKHIAKK